MAQSSIINYTDAELPDEMEFSDLQIFDIPLSRARRFFFEHHYARGCGNAAMTWGLFHGPTGILVGAVAFHCPSSENTRKSIFELGCSSYDDDQIPSWNQCNCDYIEKRHGYREHVVELQRIAIVDEAPQNTGTWFLTRVFDRLKEYKPKYWAIISMADTTEGHDGTLYQAASADYYGRTGGRKFYIDEKGRLRSPRQNGENIREEEAKKRGWDVVWRGERHRYLFWLPDRYREDDRLPTSSKDHLRQMASVEFEEYPE